MNLYLWSKPLNSHSLALLIEGAKIIEQSWYGAKVYKLRDGNFLKIFRLKRIFSSALLFSYSRRFCLNAERLKRLGIPTVKIIQLYSFPKTKFTAVLYEPVEGKSLREIGGLGPVSLEIWRRLGCFLVDLHQRGIYFRSLHLGNIILMENGSFGLIDISDISIYPWALHHHTRLRNFKRLFRYEEDRHIFGEEGKKSLISAYAERLMPASKDYVHRVLD